MIKIDVLHIPEGISHTRVVVCTHIAIHYDRIGQKYIILI